MRGLTGLVVNALNRPSARDVLGAADVESEAVASSGSSVAVDLFVAGEAPKFVSDADLVFPGWDVSAVTTFGDSDDDAGGNV